jgi:hypothetical protein
MATLHPDVAALYVQRRDAEVALLEGLAEHLRLTHALRNAKRDMGYAVAEPFEDAAFVARAASLDPKRQQLLTWLAQCICLARSMERDIQL